MKRTICVMTITLLAAIAGFADSAPIGKPVKTPKPAKTPKSIITQLQISLRPDVNDARLIIPKNQLKELRAAIDDLDQEDDATAAVTAPSFSRTQTIVSGMFLSLAMVFGGVWFVRSGKAATRSGKTLVVLALIAGICSAATFVYADIARPKEHRWITGKMFSENIRLYDGGSGEIKLEVSNTATSVELIAPNRPDNPGGE